MLRATTLRTFSHPDRHLPDDIESQIVRCDRYFGRGRTLRRDSARDLAATQLVEYFNNVLGHHGYSLSEEGEEHIGNLVTEVIGNAEEHSGRWYTQGYSHLDIGSTGLGIDDCHIVIFNFGKTIYESLSAPSAAKDVRELIKSLASHHASKGNFNGSFTEEGLWTLSALQQGVSRQRNLDPSRGKGTIRMIRAFLELADKPYKMAVISGSSYILFDSTYKLFETISPHGEKLAQITFNKEKDLKYPPDPANVFQLKRSFPGTIISLRFSLSKGRLETVAKGKDDA